MSIPPRVKISYVALKNARKKFFLILLDMYFEEDAPAGLINIESALSDAKGSFSEHQITRLYQYAAKFCRKMGFVQKSLEYLNLTFGLSPAQND